MDIEAARDYLNQVKEQDDIITLKQKRLDDLNAQATYIRSPDYSADRVRTSPSGDGILQIVAMIIDLQAEINADIDKFVDLKANIMSKLNLLRDREAARVLYKKYFEYKPTRQIAEELHCSKRKVQRIHRFALAEFSKLNKMQNTA